MNDTAFLKVSWIEGWELLDWFLANEESQEQYQEIILPWEGLLLKPSYRHCYSLTFK